MKAATSGRLFLALLRILIVFLWCPATQAIEIVTATSTNYNTTDTISSSITSWTEPNGWGVGNTNDGWNYVGLVTVSDGYGSGVYLGNGWVITAGHVGAGTFSLDGNIYDPTGKSYSDFTYNFNGTNQIADLTLFQISTASLTENSLSLPSLTLASNAPAAFASNQAGSQVVMIGYGGLLEESWGFNTVTAINQSITVNAYNYESLDDETTHGITSYTTGFGHSRRTNSITNNAELYPGDSGGAEFINVSGSWELAGVNEAVGTGSGNLGESYFVQISAYDTQIESAMEAVPEPSALLLLGAGALISLLTKR